MTTQWAGMPEKDPFAGTPYALKPMPADEVLIAAIEKEKGDLRRIAWELGNLDYERLYYHVTRSNTLRPIYFEAGGR